MTEGDARPTGAGAGGDDASGPPEEAVLLSALGPARDVVGRFHDLLAEHGVTRGLIGPREVPRLWQRHLLNSAAVAALLPESGTLVDIGTGAGLPGVVLAAMRPELHVILLEPMERRVTWLREVVEALALTNTEVVRGRAEQQHGRLVVEAVTARAVAPMDRLAGWAMPLLAEDGVLLAMKGSQAQEELDAAAGVIDQWGGGAREVLEVSAGGESTRVVRVRRETHVAPTPTKKAAASTTKAKRARR
ncbi:16S rRNA (guanine(527)-N(7))-methyltransferase RsmG [Actinotalea solisilvae]|uniref:16S rRNA (guanine(527)-N(7))-methyltransferase RsmG n=1 Tax=Actinotalea solisilvae TaxID=2072922 RepID=UPI0027DAFBD1|nr:16S rRNA (guanine(527)-N(7))-methyltransferase RsmG [Actinotalea solisilvae]